MLFFQRVARCTNMNVYNILVTTITIGLHYFHIISNNVIATQHSCDLYPFSSKGSH